MELVSLRAKKIKSSPTLALAAKAKELAAQGHDVVSLSVGEPDWPTFQVAQKAAHTAIDKNFTKYTPSNGTPEIRKSIAKALAEETGCTYSPEEITVTAGGKFAIFSALHAVLNTGDEVIIPAPFWVSYPTMVEMLEARPVPVLCESSTNFKMTAEQLARAITPKTRLLILNSPSNPTGQTYTSSELQDLARVLDQNPHVMVMSDDIYNRLMFDGTIAPHILQANPALRSRTLVINGASKSFSMTGWRVGWAAGPAEIIKAMTNYQSQTVSCASGPSLEAARAALDSGADELRTAIQLLRGRLDFSISALSKINGLKVFPPTGAFYLWVDVSSTFGKTFKGRSIRNSADFSEILLSEYKVAVVPGAEFGTEGFVRMSFALNEERMKEAFSRIANFTSSLG